jgi:hypothetical protein
LGSQSVQKMSSVAEQLLESEKKLLDPVLCRTPERLASLLADDFVEFGSSGRSYDKRQVLYRLGKQVPSQLAIEEFRLVELGPDAALVTYRARADSGEGRDEKYSLRSSVWVRHAGEWKMIFHQGTMIAEHKPLKRFPGLTDKTAADSRATR